MSLENFKKQAKLLVRWHRERNYSVGGRIRQLSRYEDLTDTEALALPFLLNEAQEIIALEQGYNSWAELKQGLKKAPTIRRAPAALKLTKAMPVLYVSDVQAAADFYATSSDLQSTSSTASLRSTPPSAVMKPASICDSYISRCTSRAFAKRSR